MSLKKILVLDRKTASGTAIAGELLQNFTDMFRIDELFGEFSPIARILRYTLHFNHNGFDNCEYTIDIMPVDPEGSVDEVLPKCDFSLYDAFALN